MRPIYRRDFLTTLAALALGVPFSARAQASARKVILFNRTPELGRAFVAGLRELGWEEGRNLLFEEVRDTPDNREALRAELERAIRGKPDVLVLPGPIRIAAAASLTKTVPIVGNDLESDPVAAGFVKSLARPGGNVTGIWVDFPELAGKQLQYLREALPGISAVGVLWDDRVGPAQLSALRAVARAINVAVLTAVVRAEAEVDAAVERLAREGAKALVALTAPTIFMSRARICDVALKHRLALSSVFSVFPDSGALLGYGPNLEGIFRQSAGHVNRILRGAKPAEIPVERPTRFELVVNAKTAKALGIKIPASHLTRADRVIE